MWRFLYLLLAMLSACETPLTRNQQLSIYRTRCLEYGYTPGTVEFANCMHEQEKHYETLSVEERKIKLMEEKNNLARKEMQSKEKDISHSKWKIQW